MKRLFKFTLDKDIKEIVKDSTTNDKGETVTTEKEVIKEVKQEIILRKPTRSLFDEAELFYGVILSQGIKAGLLTRALLAKRFSNDGGVLSEDDKDKYADLYLKLYETQLDVERLSTTSKKKRTQEDESKLTELLEESANLRRQLTDFEMAQSSLFEQTAENRARNKTILWWVLNLSYLQDGDTFTQIFEGKTFEEKLDSYDAIELKEDDFSEELLKKLIYYVSFWYVGRVTSEEDFNKLLEESGEEVLEEAPKTEEAVEPEVKKEDKLLHEHEDGTKHSHEGGDKEHTHDESTKDKPVSDKSKESKKDKSNSK